VSNISAPHFHDEVKAYEYVEARLWPNGPVCPHCGGVERVGKLKGKTTRAGLWKCYQCRKPFTVKIGTIFEDSKVPMHKWLQAIYLVAGSKKGISSNQLHRILGVTLKTAWFMSHRIREAMRDDSGFPLGGLEDLTGSWAIPPVPLPCSQTPAGLLALSLAVRGVQPPRPTRRRPRRTCMMSRLHHTASVPAAYASRSALPRYPQGSLPAGRWPLPGGSRTLWIAAKSFRTLLYVIAHPPFPGFSCR